MHGDLAGGLVNALLPKVALAAGAVLLFSFLFLAFRKLVLPKLKGALGEAVVNARLKERLDPQVYHLIPDVMLPTDDGTTQIDHVVVSRYGVFVIETKTYAGWIFGNERDAQWTQSLYRKKNRFQNPLRQNYKHTKTLSELLGIPDQYFKSIVAFGGECEFKTQMPANVVYSRDLAGHILEYNKPLIKDEQVPEVVAVISEWAATVTAEQKANHVAHLREKKGVS